MEDFSFKFTKQPAAKPVKGNVIRVPNFEDKTMKLGPGSFTLYGDASDIDFSNAGDMINSINFSNTTKFPPSDKIPKGFNPNEILENGKAPGLNVGDLHALGITGKGITVAILDQALNTEHIEIKDNIIHYESIGYPENKTADYHGTAVSSLLAGKTLGVAPDAKIVYFATNNLMPRDKDDKPFQLRDSKPIYFGNKATALKKILFMNARLPKNKKISAVSISNGTLGRNEECTKLINQLIDSGVMVLTCDSYNFYGVKGDFTTIDRRMNSDADNIESYYAGFWRDNLEKLKYRLLAPAGGRTIAGFQDNSQYIYCGDGGMSWATPYIVGVYALAKQVMPSLTPQHFFDVAHQVGASSDKLGDNVIIQPKKIIEYLQNENIILNQHANIKN